MDNNRNSLLYHFIIKSLLSFNQCITPVHDILDRFRNKKIVKMKTYLIQLSSVASKFLYESQLKCNVNVDSSNIILKANIIKIYNCKKKYIHTCLTYL